MTLLLYFFNKINARLLRIRDYLKKSVLMFLLIILGLQSLT